MNQVISRSWQMPHVQRLTPPRLGLVLLIVLIHAIGIQPSSLLRGETSNATRPGEVDPRPVGELQLVTDDFVQGQLMDSDQSNTLLWRGTSFTGAFDFEIPAIRSIRFPNADAAPRHAPAGAYCFEFGDGDFLYGSLLALSENELTIEVPGEGPLTIRRDVLHRIVRLQEGNALVYDGPRGLTGWTAEPENAWSDDGGRISAREPGSTLSGDFNLPALARIELEISWKSAPDFSILFGSDSAEESRQYAFRLEAWRDELVLVRERERDADVVLLQKIGPVQGAAKFHIYFDQVRGRMLVHSAGGPLLGELDFQEKNSRLRGGIELINSSGEIRLERLRITRWNGQTPRAVDDDQERVYLADGTVRYGTLRSFRADQGQFVISRDGRDVVIEQGQLESAALVFAASPDPAAPSRLEKRMRVVRRDGVRIAGQLRKVESGQMWLNVPGFREPWRASLADLHSVIILQHDVPSTPVGGRIGRLEMPGVRLQGVLVDGVAKQESSGLVWHPRGSKAASALREGAVGRIVYHEARPANAPNRGPETRRGAVPAPRVGIVGGFFRALTGESSPPSTNRPTLARALHLRTGDVIPGEVERIDESGVTFRTPVSDATFVPHDKIKSLDIDLAFGAPRTDPLKRERLLILPRVQRGNPPTHLILSRSGDYLRARLLEMDQKMVTVELRLETQAIPRERIAQIIWLHEDELAANSVSATSSQAHPGIRVQAVRHDGIRLTFLADRVSEESVVGNSDILGPCRVKIDDVDQLLLGEMIEQSAAKLARHQWRLQHAPDPKYLEQGSNASGGERMPGTESPLVGEMAPPVSLPLLGGGKFELAEHRGKVVVLDFWATWCGPCMQVMPQIERTVASFDEQQVALIAINLQETPDTIRSTLERWRLDPKVALDQDGVAAQRYRVNAIPQTVIVDRDGRVARLFVGGGSDFGQRLETALTEILKEVPKVEP